MSINNLIRSTLQMVEPRWRQRHISASSAVVDGSLKELALEAQRLGGSAAKPPAELVVTLRHAGYVLGIAA